MWRHAFCSPSEYLCNACHLYARRHEGRMRPSTKPKATVIKEQHFQPIGRISIDFRDVEAAYCLLELAKVKY